jgi:hypothetical protein
VTRDVGAEQQAVRANRDRDRAVQLEAQARALRAKADAFERPSGTR